MINPFNFIQMYQQFRQNPIQMLSKKYNLPQNMNNPDQIIQYLLNSGQVTQREVNEVMQIKNNPQFQQLFNQK